MVKIFDINRMSNNLKAPAKQVQNACRTVKKSDFDKIISANSGERAKQWKNIKRAFYQNCDAATVAAVSHNVNPEIIKQLNPPWSTETAARVKANAAAIAATGGMRYRRKMTKTNHKKHTRKTRRLHRR